MSDKKVPTLDLDLGKYVLDFYDGDADIKKSDELTNKILQLCDGLTLFQIRRGISAVNGLLETSHTIKLKEKAI